MRVLVNWLLSKQRVFLLLIDVAMLALAVTLAAWMWLGGPEYVGQYRWQVSLVVVLYVVCLFANNLYDIHRDYAEPGVFWNIAAAIGTGFAVSMALFFAFPPLKVPSRPIFFLNAVFSVVLVYAGRRLYERLFRGRFHRRVVIVGMGMLRDRLLELFRDGRYGIYELVGVVSLSGGEQQAMRLPDGVVAYSVDEAIKRLSSAHQVDVVAVASRPLSREMVRALIRCMQDGCEVLDAEELIEQLSGRVPYRMVEEEWFLYARIGQRGVYQRLIKPLIERTVALVLLILSLPVLVIAAVAIKLLDRGPVLFRQERLGLLGKPFRIVKLRTMRSDAEAQTGPVWASPNDPRVTPLGTFLRRTRIDELPQLWNVVCGEMAFVGPRPEREYFIEQFKETIPYYAYRLTVLPGITGWAQIQHPYDSSVESVMEKLEYDFYYIKHCSLALDVAILLKTFRVMLSGFGSR